MVFKVSLDKLAKGVTIGMAVLFIALPIWSLYLIGELHAATIIAPVFGMIIFFITYAYRPVHYVLHPDNIIIKRGMSDIVIHRSNVQKVELIDKERLSGSMRIFGVGGMFGYFGKFTNHKIGVMIWYATRRDKAVLIVTKQQKKYIITPDEADTFVSQFSSLDHIPSLVAE